MKFLYRILVFVIILSGGSTAEDPPPEVEPRQLREPASECQLQEKKEADHQRAEKTHCL